jgi:hypothetical protein
MIIQMGDERPGSSKGPERLVQAGAEKLVAAKEEGFEPSVQLSPARHY